MLLKIKEPKFKTCYIVVHGMNREKNDYEKSSK